jgi:hypothetical protein
MHEWHAQIILVPRRMPSHITPVFGARRCPRSTESSARQCLPAPNMSAHHAFIVPTLQLATFFAAGGSSAVAHMHNFMCNSILVVPQVRRACLAHR